MASYAKGYLRERAARRALEALGYNVIRSAGSHGPWDLVAYKGDEIRFIQVKSTKPKRKLIERLDSYPTVPFRPSYEIWVWKKYAGFDIFANGGRKWTLGRSLTPSELHKKTSKGSRKKPHQSSKPKQSTDSSSGEAKE